MNEAVFGSYPRQIMGIVWISAVFLFIGNVLVFSVLDYEIDSERDLSIGRSVMKKVEAEYIEHNVSKTVCASRSGCVGGVYELLVKLPGIRQTIKLRPSRPESIDTESPWINRLSKGDQIEVLVAIDPEADFYIRSKYKIVYGVWISDELLFHDVEKAHSRLERMRAWNDPGVVAGRIAKHTENVFFWFDLNTLKFLMILMNGAFAVMLVVVIGRSRAQK